MGDGAEGAGRGLSSQAGETRPPDRHTPNPRRHTPEQHGRGGKDETRRAVWWTNPPCPGLVYQAAGQNPVPRAHASRPDPRFLAALTWTATTKGRLPKSSSVGSGGQLVCCQLSTTVTTHHVSGPGKVNIGNYYNIPCLTANTPKGLATPSRVSLGLGMPRPGAQVPR